MLFVERTSPLGGPARGTGVLILTAAEVDESTGRYSRASSPVPRTMHTNARQG